MMMMMMVMVVVKKVVMLTMRPRIKYDTMLRVYYDDDNQDDGYSDYQDDDEDKTDDGRIEASELTTQSRYIQLPTNWFLLNSSQCVTQYVTL